MPSDSFDVCLKHDINIYIYIFLKGENIIYSLSDGKLKMKAQGKAARFKFTTSPKVDEMKRKVIPKNTDKCMQWALKVFNDWTESCSYLACLTFL